MEQGSIFKSNRSQAVRLPKAAAFPDDVTRVDIVTVGRARLLVPAGESWDTWFSGDSVTPDFSNDRDQPADQRREDL
ncbi:type II toxin-antitoxin system VapB family antitoxin [Achromobacter kerstersii]|uniref:type II toxin-antitoxin system VapB family antitoxin n=1 Tax=Achromobacter kerstersii TaxID=1353890 RepID=UPI0006BEFDCC|nr:type II toxin-antitoxin system VapB family antitoxin [Achromobacter kerstersii]CUJ54628.1 Antitoxin VapB [Achromobacter kerstersii]